MMVIQVKKFQNELMVKIYSKSLIRAFVKILHIKLGEDQK